MSEAAVEAIEVESVGDEAEEDDRYRDRRSLEAELQAIARSKAPQPEAPSGFWAKRHRKR